MNDFVAALGLVLVIEGLLYAAFPGVVRRMLEIAQITPEQTMRLSGLAAAILGVGIVWLARSL